MEILDSLAKQQEWGMVIFSLGIVAFIFTKVLKYLERRDTIMMDAFDKNTKAWNRSCTVQQKLIDLIKKSITK